MKTNTRTKWKRGFKERGAPAVNRRKHALSMLEQDMKSGMIRTGNTEDPTRPMEEKDRTRIMKEMETLKGKI